VKEKIYSISLLLSFLVILSHEIIPHNHHDLEEYSVSFQFDIYDHHHHADDTDHQHHGEKSFPQEKESKKQHNFPYHQHLSADNGFDYIRIVTKKGLNVAYSPVAVLFALDSIEIAHPPETGFNRFKVKPFLISTMFEPGAIGLRAPPSIA
jgi:hypothetical protein